MIRSVQMYGGIDLGGTKIQAAILDGDHKALGSSRRPTPTSGGPADVAAEMETALRDAAKAAEVEPSALAGLGVGSPVRVGNDVQVATRAEFALGSGRPYRSLLGVFWGTGVGGGLILDGETGTGRGGAGA